MSTGRDAESTAMPTASAAATSPVVLVAAPPRDPGNFSGTDGEDVDEWLRLYELVSANHRWDPTLMLANLIFYLKGTAKAWFNNNVEELTSWDICKTKLREVFGHFAGCKRAAKQALGARVQTSTESYLAYIQDVLTLCRKADATMAEAEKVAHVLKGIADDAFNLIVFRGCSTINDVITECRRFDEAKSRRIVHHFTRLPNTAATSTCEDLRMEAQPIPNSNDITRIVRREIEAASPAPLRALAPSDPQPTISLIQTVVRQELANAGLQTICSVHRPDAVTPPSWNPRPYYRRPAPSNRDPNAWRTPDDRPICFRCERVGHISRHCRSTRNSPSRPTSSFYNFHSSAPTSNQAPPRHDDSVTYDPTTPSTDQSDQYSRSPSPRRRGSRSPPPRRFPSPSNSRPFPSGN
uniref:CCHC-type domain-containing protein n=1 Tax=Rhipicephalus pulchellus TaxID=72859 RepID=L7M0E9_RHIPC